MQGCPSRFSSKIAKNHTCSIELPLSIFFKNSQKSHNFNRDTPIDFLQKKPKITHFHYGYTYRFSSKWKPLCFINFFFDFWFAVEDLTATKNQISRSVHGVSIILAEKHGLNHYRKQPIFSEIWLKIIGSTLSEIFFFSQNMFQGHRVFTENRSFWAKFASKAQCYFYETFSVKPQSKA